MTAFVPSAEQRKVVRAMAAFGVPQIEICKVIGIGDRTLRKAFREELDRASIEANATVAEVCFRMATLAPTCAGLQPEECGRRHRPTGARGNGSGNPVDTGSGYKPGPGTDAGA